MSFPGCELKIQEETSTPLQLETKRITNDPWPKRDLAWSPDGRYIAYTADRRYSEILKVSLTGETIGKMADIIDFNGNFRPALSPDGSKLAYVSRQRGHIGIFDFQEQSDKLLTVGQGNASLPAWSHDGEWLAYAVYDRGRYTIWTIRPNGEDARQITSPAELSARAPTWSPDGTQLAFQAPDTGLTPTLENIFVVSLASGKIRRLISSPAYRYYPAWSPDGSRIAFREWQNDTMGVWIVSVDGGEAKKLTSMIRHADYPSWSPDGSKIAFVDDNSRLWIYSFADGTITETNVSSDYSLWFPDGNTFLRTFTSSFSQLSLAELENLQIKLPTADSVYTDDRYPCWFPDNDRIAFLRRDNSGRPEIRIISLATGENNVIAKPPSPYYIYNPAISPNGLRAACDDGSNTYIYFQNGGWLQILEADLFDWPTQPTWSPDSKQLACRTSYGLRIFNIQESGSEPLAFFPGEFRNPAWSADHPSLGSRIAFERNPGIYIFSPADPKPELAIPGGRYPSWSLDGTKIAYVLNNDIYVSTVFVPFAD